VLGPLNTDHAPVPTVGVLAANVADPVVQIVWIVPAFEMVGGAFTVMVTSEVDAVHGELLIVHLNT
jgi:hypothetical protein